jgi:hypothetical protein
VKTITWVLYKFSEPQQTDYGCFHTVVFQQGIALIFLVLGGKEGYLIETFPDNGLAECQGYGHHHQTILCP